MMNIDRVYYNALKKVTVIVFQNDVLLELKVSLNILNNQILFLKLSNFKFKIFILTPLNAILSDFAPLMYTYTTY